MTGSSMKCSRMRSNRGLRFFTGTILINFFLRGGWLNPDSPKWFADYVEVVVDKLSDRVGHWITLNEPQCFLHLGHSVGEHAPGLKLGIHEVLLATHHALLAHGLGVQAIRARAKKQATRRLGAGGIVLLSRFQTNPKISRRVAAPRCGSWMDGTTAGTRIR